MDFTDLAERVWYEGHPLSIALLPLSWLYRIIMLLRTLAYGSGVVPVGRVPVPVIVIGNISVGGTGKTPLTIWLCDYLKQKGMKPGIISRGYGGKKMKWPQQVRPDSDPNIVGDEPIVIARRTGCPVAIATNRYLAAMGLVEHHDVNVILSDDGLQHLKLARDLEIAVIDGDRRFGNGRCLPAGPLREPVSRLHRIELVVANGKVHRGEHLMEYESASLRNLKDPNKQCELDLLKGETVHAVAGIGNPSRFFSYLRSHQIHAIKHEFPDHHRFTRQDLQFDDGVPVVMTEKDAVKCERFASDNIWYLPITAKLGTSFIHRLDNCLKEIGCG